MTQSGGAGAARRQTIIAVGFGQLLAWGSSYYLLAVLAKPMARELALSPVAVYAMFSAALVVAAVLGPRIGALIDRRGGRYVLQRSNGVFALALLVLATATTPAQLALGWLLLGAAMPMGLYDAAFSTLVGLYRQDARRAIVAVTLIAGFASSVSWPLTSYIETHWGWRSACAFWSLLHLILGLHLHRRLLPVASPSLLHQPAQGAVAKPVSRVTLGMLAATFTCTGFVFGAMATHLPRVLEAVGCTPAAAIAAASLVGASQVAGRLAEAGYLNRLHPVVCARLACSLHPIAALLLYLFGPPLAVLFTVLHGMGVGLITIVKGTLPLALFGSAGFGQRSGALEAPSRIAQACAPLAFGYALERWGSQALWISGGVALLGFCGVVVLQSKTEEVS